MRTSQKILKGLHEARMSAKAHYKKVMQKLGPTQKAFDPQEYPPIRGMEGPFQFKSGRVLYYDPKEGAYYDRKTDLFYPRDFDPMNEAGEQPQVEPTSYEEIITQRVPTEVPEEAALDEENEMKTANEILQEARTVSLAEKEDVVTVLAKKGFTLEDAEDPWYIFSHGKKNDNAAQRLAVRELDKAGIDFRSVGTGDDGMIEVEMLESTQPLDEGIYDPYILKCIFLGGGGGSGKGFIGELMFGTMKDMATTSFGVKSLNTDNALAALTGGLDTQKSRGRFPNPVTGIGGRAQVQMTQDFFGTEQGIETRQAAKRITKARRANIVAGRLGIIVDGTADDPAKIARLKKEYEALGYDCSMVLVNTTVEVAVQRNAMRSRNVPEDVLRQSHAQVQRSIPKFKSLFGSYTLISGESYKSMRVPGMVEVENSKSVSPKEVKRKLSPLLWKVAKKILQEPLKNPIGHQWLKDQTADMPPSALSKVTWLGKKKGR